MRIRREISAIDGAETSMFLLLGTVVILWIRRVLYQEYGRCKSSSSGGNNQIEVEENGFMTFFSGDTPLMTDQLGIYKFQNNSGLMSAGGGKYRATEASGEAETASDAKIKQGYLENSNVNLAEEMTRLIRAQRAFTLAGRALSTADQMEGLANNMKR